MVKIRVGIFTGTIVLDKKQFNVRQLYVTERLKHLVKYKDLDTTVICPEDISLELKDLNCNYIFYKMSKRRHFKVITALLPAFFKLLKVDCDVIHIYSHELAMAAIIAQKIRRKKFKILFEPMGLVREESRINARSSIKTRILRPFSVRIEKIIFNNSLKIITYTYAMKEYISDKYDIPERNIFVSPVGIDKKLLKGTEKDFKLKEKLKFPNNKIVMYAGSISELHGSLTLVRAIKALRHYNTKAAFVIIGNGVLKPKIEDYIKKNNLNNVLIPDFVPHDALPKYLALADILIIPHARFADSERIFPTKLLEYLAAEKPIVVSNLKAIAEVVGANAVLVEPDNPQALAEGVLKVLEDEKLAKRLGKGGKKIAEKYSWEESAKEAYEAYKSCSKILMR